jgi:hypothetical protein
MPLTRAEKINTWLTAAIFVATASSGVIFYLQWREMRGATAQTKSIIDEAGSQVTATNRLAQATEIANQNAVQADRPWIGSAGVSTTEPLESGKAGSVTLSLLNTGKTPARIIRFRAASNVFPKFPDDPPYPISGSLYEISRTILVPGIVIGNAFPFSEVAPPLFELLQQQRDVKFYVYAMAEYEDIRVPNVQHVTKLCYFWTGRAGNLAFGTCPQYNDAN